MELKTKKFIALFVSLAIFLVICISSVYAYSNPDDTFFATSFSVFAALFVPFYYMWKGKKEERQKHFLISILIFVFIPIIQIIITTYRWYVGLPSILIADGPISAFLIVWADAFVNFVWGITFVIAAYHTDEIVEKLTKSKN
ncbi:hypothetical protein MmiEs2_12340 [Methanimicrococcus stummii]|uniref:Uncharacterized protein n=1 Tax=Methanimicrococcus stummii TaxID=3028294 RepID=A0AA96VB41_9EURY|nr:hypothetical protein [Methanimicrococcus sp. Es2]WNY29020.1 hypothetical protein MmiEs2_12340 [Methanimicrococcus sp. Es2]